MKRLVFLLGVAGLTACAGMGSKEPDPIQTRLAALEKQSQSLRAEIANQERMLNGLGAVGLGSAVAKLEEQLRDLRGELEELSFNLEQQQNRQRALYTDLDERLVKLEGGGGAERSAAVRAVDSNADQKAYLAAFQHLKAGDYDSAVSGFATMLSAHPKSPYAPNAQYWIGEAHYVQRQFNEAWDAFAQVLAKYPASAKAPDALLKQGLLRIEQGKIQEARQLLERVSTRFPNSSASGLANDRLQRLGEG